MKDKIQVLCVEDGSVDIDELQDLQDGKVLVYRQGSKPPFILEMERDKKPYISVEKWYKLKRYVKANKEYDGWLKNVYLLMDELEFTEEEKNER
jgi:hypothetical protein